MRLMLACCLMIVAVPAQGAIFLQFGFSQTPAQEAAAAQRRAYSHERSLAKMQMSHEKTMARYGVSSRYQRTPIFNGNRAYFYQPAPAVRYYPR